jgi:hypothetical protein
MFELQEIALPPASALVYREADWRDALVLLEVGEIDLETVSGARRRVYTGDVFWLVGLPLRALHNAGTEAAVLVAVSRMR